MQVQNVSSAINFAYYFTYKAVVGSLVAGQARRSDNFWPSSGLSNQSLAYKMSGRKYVSLKLPWAYSNVGMFILI